MSDASKKPYGEEHLAIGVVCNILLDGANEAQVSRDKGATLSTIARLARADWEIHTDEQREQFGYVIGQIIANAERQGRSGI